MVYKVTTQNIKASIAANQKCVVDNIHTSHPSIILIEGNPLWVFYYKGNKIYFKGCKVEKSTFHPYF